MTSIKTYISILRGINVSGQKPLKMDALKAMYEGLGFINIRTYIQSGNVVFDTSETDRNVLAAKIEEHINRSFGFNVPVIVLDPDLLRSIIEKNPLTKADEKEEKFIYVTFLADRPADIDREGIETSKLDSEEIHITNHAVYVYCPAGYGKSKLSNNFLERKLKTKATTRNWKTTLELLKMTVT